VDSDPAPVPSDGQLVTFDRFESKDPFVPQVSDAPAGQPSAPSAPAGGDVKTAAPKQQNGGGATSAPQPASQQVSKTASIAMNGTEHEVSPGGSFPKDEPIFRLTSLKKGTESASWRRANGAPTITRRRAEITLMNTARHDMFWYVG
jgi:hypothetical protein